MAIVKPELLSSVDLRVLAIQRTAAGRWWNFRNVISPFSRLWLILEGEARVRHHGREFRLKRGDMHLVPPFTAHDCFCARRMDHYHLHFVSRLPTGIDILSLVDVEFQLPAPAHARDHFLRLEQLFPDRKLPCFDPARVEYRKFRAGAELAGESLPAGDWFEANGVLMLLLAPFMRSAREHQGVHTRATRQFLAVQQFMHAHMRENLLLRDLARAAGLNPTYFSDRFEELVGVRPLAYLTRRRIERAQLLLLTSTASVKQVAVEVGIPDAAYFTRVFTRECGVSPSEYRAAHS